MNKPTATIIKTAIVAALAVVVVLPTLAIYAQVTGLAFVFLAICLPVVILGGLAILCSGSVRSVLQVGEMRHELNASGRGAPNIEGGAPAPKKKPAKGEEAK